MCVMLVFFLYKQLVKGLLGNYHFSTKVTAEDLECIYADLFDRVCKPVTDALEFVC